MEKNIGESVEHAKEVVTDELKDWVVEANKALYLKNNKKGVFDALQEKLISRKLLVFVTATVLMWFGLDPETWGLIAICYIGGQSAIDAAQVWRHGKSEQI